jgi:hypothetical protein
MGQDPAGGEVRNGEAGGSGTLGRSYSKTSGSRPEENEARLRTGRRDRAPPRARRPVSAWRAKRRAVAQVVECAC